MTEVYCVNNYGYKWTISNNIFFKGYFILNKILYRDESAVKYLSSLSNYDDFIDSVRKICGCFAIIIKKDDELWSAVDRARSMPIYFSSDGKAISDSAETIREKLNIPVGNINKKNLTSLLYSQFTLLNNTVYNDIKQLNVGQVLFINGDSVQHEYYYRHIANVVEINKADAISALGNVLCETFDRLITAINGRPVLLSLSGGYDSRLVACMLKEKGVNDVTCYTYGGLNSYEVEISRKVAEKLGYEWHCVTYTDDDIKSIFTSENDEFFKITNNHDYIIYLQNYIAVRKLKEEKKIKENSVIVTGLCGDMPSGVYVLPEEQLNNMAISYEKMSSQYIDNLFNQFKINENILNELKNEIESDLRKCDIELNSTQNYITLKDCMETAGVHSRCFLNANSVHGYFGFEWLLPLWDNDYLNFWYGLPMQYRANQSFYEEYLIEHLCLKYDIAFKKMKSIRPADRNKKKKGNVLKLKLKYFLGGVLTRISFLSGIPIKRKLADPNNFGAATVLLYKGIRNKKIINYKKANFKHLLNIYILEKRYGKFNLK
ncbi:MAG: asparagine synthase-related protein [Oscillospiraceae bacterium]|nr:asparagine synthase-related protein [Oscillospiraceae bacterium]